jgi:hypothetical protein
MYKILSIFSGGGGLDLGFHGGFKFLDTFYPKLNFETKFANKSREARSYAARCLVVLHCTPR